MSEPPMVPNPGDVADALEKQRFAHQVAAELAELRADKNAWKSYLADADAASVADGVDR